MLGSSLPILDAVSEVQLLEMLLWFGMVAATLVSSFAYTTKRSDWQHEKNKEAKRLETQLARLAKLRDFVEERLQAKYFPFDDRFGLLASVSYLYFLEKAYREMGVKAIDDNFDCNLQNVIPVLQKHIENLTNDRSSARPELVLPIDLLDKLEKKKAG